MFVLSLSRPLYPLPPSFLDLNLRAWRLVAVRWLCGVLAGMESCAPNSDSPRTEIWVTMKTIPATAIGILGVAYGTLFYGALMATNAVVFEETRMVAVVVICGDGGFGGDLQDILKGSLRHCINSRHTVVDITLNT